MADVQVDQLVRRGLLRQPLRAVYIDTAAPDDLRTRAACVALVLPAGAAVCRRTAAWLWNVDTRGPGQLEVPLQVECTVPLGREPLCRDGVIGYVAPLRPDDVTMVDGVPCTTPLRTAVDLLRYLRPHMALGSADALAHAGLISVPELIEEVEHWTGYRGVAQARRLAALVEPLTESFGESWTRLRVIDADFPRPEVQIRIVDDGGHLVYRLDLGWPEVQKGLEYNGLEFHSSPEARAKDEERLERLGRQFGWEMVPVDRGDILGRSLRFERGVGELLSLEPQIIARSW